MYIKSPLLLSQCQILNLSLRHKSLEAQCLNALCVPLSIYAFFNLQLGLKVQYIMKVYSYIASPLARVQLHDSIMACFRCRRVGHSGFEIKLWQTGC